VSYTDRVLVMARFANELARLSKCTERHTAAIVADKLLQQIYSIGVNGGAAGIEDCMCVSGERYGCIHAEINALVKCVSADPDKSMFITLSPCKPCAAAIINAPGRIQRVYMSELWYNTDGIGLLLQAGISCFTVNLSAGLVVPLTTIDHC
jgi:deoxycytidylate deaminase